MLEVKCCLPARYRIGLPEHKSLHGFPLLRAEDSQTGCGREFQRVGEALDVNMGEQLTWQLER